MLAILIGVSLGAAPMSARLTYETKCLYCHSEEVSEQRPLTEAKWRQVIEQMRKKAPMLITRGDVPVLTAYMTQTLKLLVPTRPRRAAAPKPAPILVVTPEPKVEVPMAPPIAAPVPEPLEQPAPAAALAEEPPPPSPEQLAIEEQGFALMQRRCSKCHTLGRVYGKLDSFERSRAILERMRLKTGSGITERDFKLLEEYLRTQF